MTKRMLIDATHDEETRVAVIDGKNTLVDFDYESQFRKALKGSIFLAKVTRVEPSLQAAFVNYGGNRHGFLPFSEIHPDYFRIPIADREALLAEQEAAMAEAEAAEEAEDAEALKDAEQGTKKHKNNKKSDEPKTEDNAESDDSGDDKDDLDEDVSEDDLGDNESDDADDIDGNTADDNADDDSGDDESSDEEGDEKNSGNDKRRRHPSRGRRNNSRGNRSRGAQKQEDNPERRFRYNLRRKYKIQEVIKRGQIMLIQVSKEERGNKGAAVGSYLSLPGRYCVLMPNSPRAGGVSRKIANYKDRARMREIMKDLQVPKGMSVILRTAGVERTKTEIKRDLDYLLKLSNNIRELTLQSSAPALVYEEADLIKRAVRDLYTRDVEEIIVSGDDGYKNAKNFMKMMIPSHAKRVKEYQDSDMPLFNKYKIEKQIAEIGEVSVTLPSGGYLVINPTEALVSIDVNSGKSTKERHIEETALRTNLEAAEEVARQLRLRDLGGLVVIDFIDMEDRRNNGKVERKMRDALSGDRARVQNGRISSFGLMELSRQRLNPSLTEAQFEICTNCAGTGSIRTADASSIMVLRAIEDEGIKARAAQLIVHVSNAVAVYILNNKRNNLAALEKRYNLEILIRVDDTVGASTFRVEVSKPIGKSDDSDDSEADSTASSKPDSGRGNNRENNDNKGDEDRPSRSRRRGRRGGRRRGNRDNDQNNNDADGNSADQNNDQSNQSAEAASDKPAERKEDDKSEKPKRAPRKRSADKSAAEPKVEDAGSVSADVEDKPKKKPASRSKPKADDADAKAAAKKDEKDAPAEKKPAASKSKAAAKKAKPPSNDDGAPKENPAPKDYETVNEAPDKKKKGWWNRLGGE